MDRKHRVAKAIALSFPILLASCGGGDQTSQSAEPPAVNLPVTTASLTTSMDGTAASGTVESDDRVQLVARASGTIRAPDLYDGQPVRRGQILATIDARQAEAAVRRASAALDAALAEQRNAHGDVTRDAPLAQSGALAMDAYRKEQLRDSAAAAGVTQAQAALTAAQVDLAYTSVASPFDGFVVSRKIRDGDMVMPGSPLVTVESRGQLVFRFAAPQASLGMFVPGAATPVLLDGREDRPVTGKVRGVVPSADPATRRYTVEIVLPADSGIMPGMFGRVRLPSATNHGVSGDTVAVPAAAITDRGGLTGVFVVGQDKRLTFRWVRPGDRLGDRVTVTSGLSAGERILARVDRTVRDGARLAGGATR